jgi:hypothetical protein
MDRSSGLKNDPCQIGSHVYLLLTGGDKNTKKEQTGDIDCAIGIREKELGKRKEAEQ